MSDAIVAVRRKITEENFMAANVFQLMKHAFSTVATVSPNSSLVLTCPISFPFTFKAFISVAWQRVYYIGSNQSYCSCSLSVTYFVGLILSVIDLPNIFLSRKVRGPRRVHKLKEYSEYKHKLSLRSAELQVYSDWRLC